ncbi:hypothetical protein FIBSPDRAFT_885868 [Athelia psychrophila]|uniref:C2 domain-containing protein n=1 Tax=Athelia psychrophila TaxID=1759441 RepID=A0A166RI70_9AGAM|nr:hypothetical protein FIBSPDRAFT_885868 [Fibularhizoctonia sp. CBS 109695]
MLSASSIDVRALGDLPYPRTNRKLTHLFRLKIDGKKVFESQKVPRESLVWKENMQFDFTPSSNVEVSLHRKSRVFKWRRPVLVAEYSGRGMDFLDTEGAELVAKSGTSHLTIKADVIAKSHTDFMKAVKDEISQLTKVNGADAAQVAITIGSKMATVLVALVPVIDNFAGYGTHGRV